MTKPEDLCGAELNAANEKIYDEQIAPLLLQAGKLCEGLGLSMCAVVEYGEGLRGETKVMGKDSSFSMLMLSHWAKVAPNLDSFYISAIRYCRKHGIDTGGSMVATMISRAKSTI